MILVWVLVALVLILGIIVAGTESGMALDRVASTEHAASGQAHAVAEAGVVDAYAWFRRQQVQPVFTFAPQRDLTQNPPINQTDDPTVGLMREYEVSPSLWARYEIRLSSPAESFTDSNSNGIYDADEDFVDTDGDGSWDDAAETRDVSIERGFPGLGRVWLIESHGFIFKRQDPTKPLGVSPNDRIAYASVASEIRRLAITTPAGAAVCATRGDRVSIGPRGRIAGGIGAGVAFSDGTGSPAFASGSEVTGSPSSTAQPGYDGSIQFVFGVSSAELKSMADVSTTNASAIGSPIGNYTLNVIDGDATFDEDRPLRGAGIVVVLGDCTIEGGSNSFFSGLLWVGGNLTIRAPAYLRGVFIAGGTVDVRGVGGDYAELNYDESIISELLFLMGQYRHSKAIFVPREEMRDGN